MSWLDDFKPLCLPKKLLETESLQLSSHLKYCILVKCVFNASHAAQTCVSFQERKALRRFLRKTLLQNDIDLSQNEQKSLLDLKYPPYLSKGSISISHCPGLRGFVFSTDADGIGLDMELTERVKRSAVSFLSNQEEIRCMPNASYLWVAKEACFKCLYPNAPLISRITITDWKVTSGKEGYDFYFATPCDRLGQGFAWTYQYWTFALAIEKRS